MKCRLPDCASIFSAESQAIMLALDFIEVSQHDKFAIFSDSISCLQAIDSAKAGGSYDQVHTREMPLSTVYLKKPLYFGGYQVM